MDRCQAIDPGDLLDLFQRQPQLGCYRLLLLWPNSDAFDLYGDLAPAGLLLQGPEAARDLLRSPIQVVFSSPADPPTFTIPIHHPGIPRCCLVARLRDTAAFAGSQELKSATQKIQELLPALLERELPALSLARAMRCLEMLVAIGREIDRVDGEAELIQLLVEALAIHFEVPRIAMVLNDNGRTGFTVAGSLGLPLEAVTRVDVSLADYLEPTRQGKPVQIGKGFNALLPQVTAERAVILPLVHGAEKLGAIFLLDRHFPPREQLVLELLGARAAARFLALRQAQQERRGLMENSCRLPIQMVNALARAKSREDLYHQILESSVNLLAAACGSLMMVDQTGENLAIVAARGMNLALARTLRMRVGTGIAGQVAQSGSPLLVSDIEEDPRVGILNRPRFRTKSFISIPIQLRGRTIGVLNLSDLLQREKFTESDLHLLTAFIEHAAAMIERLTALESAAHFEEQAMTDPLTGVYNRRFLDRRLEEELNRSSRQHLEFSLMLLDIDHFKIYNDLCGHLAGDSALTKIAALLKETAREMDVVTRYGGEEFCILLPGTPAREARLAAERVRRELELESFAGEELLPLGRLTVSIGLATYPLDGDDPSALIHAADLALYQAKSQGRNRIASREQSQVSPQNRLSLV
ncbi:MAG TPA: sensor domain-containing diguanylate cyclase [Desulfuromonadales bacterium]|nr:sensor domain-containing diguanylate cyclase [Desulfuromonadales bacterium]